MEAMLTDDQLKTSDPQTLDLFDEYTGLPEPDSGKSPANLRDGTNGNSGRRVVRASRSRPPERGSEPMTQGTCGRTYFASSTQNAHPASWVNKLQAGLATLGSTESALVWKASATPAGRLKFRLVQSTVHKNGPGIGGSQWPTATAMCAKDSQTHRSGARSHELLLTGLMNKTAQWPAPTVADVEGGRKTRSGARSDEMLLNGLMAAQWATPTKTDAGGHGYQISSGREILCLPGQMDPSRMGPIMRASGAIPNGSNAQTEKRGAPNPVFACWLMGWPEELTSGALLAIQSFRGSRRKSSRRSLTAALNDKQ